MFCLQAVCQKLGIDTGDRLLTTSRKLKFLVQSPLPDDAVFPPFQDFEVVHHYLQTSTPAMQARLRKRGQKGNKVADASLQEFYHANFLIAIQQSLKVLSVPSCTAYHIWASRKSSKQYKRQTTKGQFYFIWVLLKT